MATASIIPVAMLPSWCLSMEWRLIGDKFQNTYLDVLEKFVFCEVTSEHVVVNVCMGYRLPRCHDILTLVFLCQSAVDLGFPAATLLIFLLHKCNKQNVTHYLHPIMRGC